MREICPDDSCTGCLACKAVCNHSAIVSCQDSLGFTFVRIDEEKCVSCGLCEKVCTSLHKPSTSDQNHTLAAVNRREEIAKRSSSAGIATLLSNSIIARGGIVYGCSGKDPYHIRHIRVSSIEELPKLQESKYVYSDLTEVYQNIRKDLLNGVPVLFIGVPCQVAAIRKFLFKPYDNLYTVDIMCHGAPSQKMLNEDLDYFKGKCQVKDIQDVRFRRKYHLPDGKLKIQYGMYFKGDGKDFSFDGIKDPFTLAYTRHQLLRDTCYECQYANPHRVSDLTLGDFWGLDKEVGFDTYEGVSLCILHYSKGEKMMEAISPAILSAERSFEEAAKGNPQLTHPTSRGMNLEIFRRTFIKKGIAAASRRANRKTLFKARLHTVLNRFGILRILHSIKR